MASSIAELAQGSDIHPLRAARVLRGLSSKELEKKAGLPRTSLSHIEAGTRHPDEGTKARLALALEVDVDALFPGSVVTRPSKPEPPRRRERTPEEQESHRLAYASIERWVREVGRFRVFKMDKLLPPQLRDRPGGEQLDPVDIAELGLLAKRLGNLEKPSDYIARHAEATTWVRETGWKLSSREFSVGLDRFDLDDNDRRRLIYLAEHLARPSQSKTRAEKARARSNEETR